MSASQIKQPDAEEPSHLSSQPADQAAASKYLDFIFNESARGFVEFRYFTAGPRPKVTGKPSYYSLPVNHDEVLGEVLSRNGQQTITVGLAPRCRIPGKGRIGKDPDVLQVNCIWANLDNKRAGGGAPEIVKRIHELPLRPSIVVNSGYGHHVYFVFNEPLHGSLLLDWSEMMRDLGDALRGDEKISISQVMRLPGTLNIKEVIPVPCEINEEFSSWTRYSINEIKAVIQIALTQPASTFIERISAVPCPTIDQLRERDLPTALIELILTGKVSDGPVIPAGMTMGESGRDFWLASNLFDKGFGIEEIKALFRAHPRGCGRTWARKRGGEKYLSVIMERVVSRRDWQLDASIDEWSDDEKILPDYLPPNYNQSGDGSIWFYPPVTDDARKALKPVMISPSPIYISQIQENIDTGQISLVISFTYLGKTRTATVLRSQISDSRQLINALAGQGAPITSNNARLITAYLAAYEHAFASRIPQKKLTSCFGRGRNNGLFFLPGLSSEIDFAPSGTGDASLYRAFSSRRGSLSVWVALMRELWHERLMIPQVAVLAALVPPLQRRLQIPNFILDIHGNTSTGKSTTLKTAASVYGKPHDPDSVILQWMNTRVAIEQVAGMCSELPIFLDDAQHCPAELKKSVVYMIANGRGKGRSGRGGRISETPTWHTVALSTSEEPLHQSSPHEGARGRILSVGGLVPPFRPGMASFVQVLERGLATCHGRAGETYIQHLNGWTEADWSRWQKRYSNIREELLKNSSSDLVGRVSGYIAAIQLAAEVACPILGLSFEPDVIGAWLMLHLDEQQSDQNMVLLALRTLADYYVANIQRFAGDGQYVSERHGVILGSSKRQQFVGFLRSTIDTIFKPHKWNQTAVLNKLVEAGVLCSTERDRHTKKVSVEGFKHRMVCIKWSALFPEDI